MKTIIEGVRLSDAEKVIVRSAAEGDKAVRDEAEAIYLRNVAAHVNGGRKSVEMNFLSETFNVCPDLALRAKYRKQVLAAQ